MANKITRSELNANFYDKLDEEISEIKKTSLVNNNKLLQIKKRLSLIDDEYFSHVIDEIDETIGIQSLYLDTSLSDEEKFFNLKNGLQTYLEEINSIVDQKIELINHFDDIFSLSTNQIASGVETKIKQLMHDLELSPSLSDKNSTILKDFERLYPGLDKNLLIIDEKFENEKDGGIPYHERLINAQTNSKVTITEIKRNLNHYKIQKGWFIFIIGLLIIGIVLAILVPIFII